MMPDKSTFAGKIRTVFPTFSRIPHYIKRGFCRFALFLWRCWKKSWRYLLGFIVLLIVLDVALGIYATAQLNHQLDLIRQKGEPLTLEELVLPPAPGETNVAVLYRQAQANIHFQIGYLDAPAGVPAAPNFPANQTTIPTYSDQKRTAAYLAKNATAIKLIRQASSESRYYFDLHLNPYHGPDVEGAHASQIMRLLSLQAIYEARTGNTNASLQDIRRLFLMARQFSTIPCEMSFIKTYVMIFKSNRALSKVLLYAKISPAQVRAFEASLPTIDLGPLAYRDFLVDRIISINCYNVDAWPYLLFNDNFPAETSLLTFRGIWKLITTPLLRLDETCTLKWYPILYKRSLKAPFPLPPKYIETEANQLDDERDQLLWYMIGTIYTFYTLPSKIPGSIETSRRERIIALALAAYHTRYHHYPSTLKSLEEFWGSALPKDLYGAKSFRYRSDGKTFHLYSIGIDRVDDGGKTDTYPFNDDIVWLDNVPY